MRTVTRLLLVVVVFAWSGSALARVRAASSRIDRAAKLLVIVAHPDDEVLVAPLLAARCVRGGASCAIVVMTSGEGGVCALADGCPPDLGTFRAGEMARAAALLNARLTQWSFPDIWSDPAGIGEAWAAHAGGRESLVRQLADVIAVENPDMILTFDPEHGSTCHPAHREVGRLVLETGAQNVFLIATAVTISGDSIELRNGAGPHASIYFAREDWEYVVRTAEIHASQFSPTQLTNLRTITDDQRRVWILPAGKPSNARCR